MKRGEAAYCNSSSSFAADGGAKSETRSADLLRRLMLDSFSNLELQHRFAMKWIPAFDPAIATVHHRRWWTSAMYVSTTLCNHNARKRHQDKQRRPVISTIKGSRRDRMMSRTTAFRGWFARAKLASFSVNKAPCNLASRLRRESTHVTKMRISRLLFFKNIFLYAITASEAI